MYQVFFRHENKEINDFLNSVLANAYMKKLAAACMARSNCETLHIINGKLTLAYNISLTTMNGVHNNKKTVVTIESSLYTFLFRSRCRTIVFVRNRICSVVKLCSLSFDETFVLKNLKIR